MRNRQQCVSSHVCSCSWYNRTHSKDLSQRSPFNAVISIAAVAEGQRVNIHIGTSTFLFIGAKTVVGLQLFPICQYTHFVHLEVFAAEEADLYHLIFSRFLATVFALALATR